MPTPKKFASITHKPSRAPLCQVLPICLWSSESQRFASEDEQRLRTLCCGCFEFMEALIAVSCLLSSFHRRQRSCGGSCVSRCSTLMIHSSTLRISPNRQVRGVVHNSLNHSFPIAACVSTMSVNSPGSSQVHHKRLKFVPRQRMRAEMHTF